MANGTAGNDFFRGSRSTDIYGALAGDDTVLGLLGNDNLNGNLNDDKVYGNQGNDTVRGGLNNDLVRGGQGNDTVFGDQDSDTVSGDLGDDIVVGGNGLENPSNPNGDRDLLYGNQGNDQLFGNEGNDILSGGKDNDTLRGGKDNDQLFGDLGDDLIYGDLGADSLTGGSGNDQFFIGQGTGGSAIAAADCILDFVSGQDIIQLIAGLTFNDLSIFQGTGANADDTIIQNQVTSEFLAVLKGITSTTITSANFLPASPSPSPTPTPEPTPTPTPIPVTPFVSLVAGPAPNETGPVNATFTLSRAGDATGALSIPYTIAGNATAVNDYTGAATGTAVFLAGEATTTITLPIINDTVVDPNETIALTLTAQSGVVISGPSTATVTIADNDLPTVAIVAGATPQEAVPPVPGSFILTRTGDISAALDVTYTVAGTATATDFTALSGTVTFAAGSANATIALATLDDTAIDAGETVAVTLTAPTGYTVAGTPATLTIVDNESSSVSIAAGTALNETGAVPGTFTLTRTGNLTAALNVNYTLSGTATATDYTDAGAGVATFAAGSATATITLTTINDIDFDPGEIVTASIAPPAGYNVGTATAQLAITDNELPTVSIIAGATPDENKPDNGTFIVTRTGSAAQLNTALTVNYTVAGTATATDFTALSGTATFAAGSASTIISVPILDDTTLDPQETVAVTLTAPTGYTVAGTPATLTIIDDESPSVSIAAGAALNETGPVPGTFTLTRTGSAAQLAAALNVSYTLGGTATTTDYSNPVTGVATFAAGSATATISLTTIDDTDFDPGEIVSASIAAPAGYNVLGSATAQVAIADNELPTVSIIAGATPQEAATPVAGTFIVTRTGSAIQLNQALTVNYTVAGTATATDFTALSGTATFAAGSASAIINVPTLDDTTLDPLETVAVTLTAPTGYNVAGTPTATLTIIDDESPSVSIAATTPLDETTPTPGVFTLTRTGSAAQLAAGLTVNYTLAGTATATDYTDAGAGVATFAAGSATTTITLTTIDDTDFDPDDIVSAAIAAPAGYNILGPASAQLAITDDDLPTIVIAKGETAIEKVPVIPGVAGTPANGTFILTRTGSAAQLAAALTVNYTVAGTAVGGAAAATGIDYNNTLLPAAGTATFAAGSANAVITLPTFNDTDIDPNETVTVTLAALAGYNVSATPVTATIVDDESPTVSITADPTAPNEVGPVNGTYTITLNTPAPTGGLVVSYTVGGTAIGGAAAAAGIDYNNTAAGLPATGTVTIAAGATTGTLTLPVFDDADLDPSETVVVTLVGAPGFQIDAAASSATLTILDDETNTVTVTPASTTAGSESGAAPGTFTLTRTGSLVAALNVNYTLAGTATNVTDYADAGAGVVTFAAGSATSNPITITPVDDAIGEGPEDVVLTIVAGAGYQLGAVGTETDTMTIADNDGTAGPDVITGGATPGVLFGGDGDDNITAGPAGDLIIGGNGNDVLTGGAGADIFRYNATTEGIDTINAFAVGVDKIGVATGIFGALPVGSNPTAGTQFISGAGTVAANGAGAPQFIYDTTTGNLRYDADGVAGGEVQISTLAGAPAITNVDIQYV